MRRFQAIYADDIFIGPHILFAVYANSTLILCFKPGSIDALKYYAAVEYADYLICHDQSFLCAYRYILQARYARKTRYGAFVSLRTYPDADRSITDVIFHV